MYELLEVERNRFFFLHRNIKVCEFIRIIFATLIIVIGAVVRVIDPFEVSFILLSNYRRYCHCCHIKDIYWWKNVYLYMVGVAAGASPLGLYIEKISGVSIRRKDRLWDRLGTPERRSILGCTWSTFTHPNKNIHSSEIVLIFSYFTFFFTNVFLTGYSI